MALPSDIISKVRRDFPEDDALRVLGSLAKLRDADAETFSDRILRCIVVLGGGEIEKVTKEIESVRRDDLRDVIRAAEYEWENRVRLLELPFGVYPEAQVFKQWLTGQKIALSWGIDSEAHWTIDYPGIREFSLEQVHQSITASKTVSDPSLYFAYFRFLFIRGPKEISASKAVEGNGFIHYRVHPEENQFEFQKFWYRPQDLEKCGNWDGV